MSDPSETVRVTCLLLALWGGLVSLQMLADARNWSNGGALGWDLQGLRRNRVYGGRLLARLFAVLSVRGIGLALFGLSILLAAWPTAPAIVAFTVAMMLMVLRIGADGGSKIALISASGALLMALGLALEQPRLVLAGTLWSGGQLTIAYATSGFAKLAMAPWRTGTALRGALSSYTWGRSFTAALLARRGMAPALAWAVILIEVLFPLALFAPPEVLSATLAAMFVLHLAIAAVMGINTYPWAFITAYPAALALGKLARDLLAA